MIHNAWHFCDALRLVFKVERGGFGVALLTPYKALCKFYKVAKNESHFMRVKYCVVV
ncbi:DUF3265 domain-containing protein (plasmid) [Vibrio europaeus]|nr:DUF3265 domain-containing protein [Vibrio europaeus]